MNTWYKLILLMGFCVSLCGCGRLAAPPEDKVTLGTHTLTIVDASGKKPFGGNSGTHQDDVAGTTTHVYNSANGRYKITLVDEVLTINDVKYTIVNPESKIRLVDDRVEINGAEKHPNKD